MSVFIVWVFYNILRFLLRKLELLVNLYFLFEQILRPKIKVITDIVRIIGKAMKKRITINKDMENFKTETGVSRVIFSS